MGMHCYRGGGLAIDIFIYIGTMFSLAWGAYILIRTADTHRKGKTLSLGLSISWWILDALWISIVGVSALYGVWSISINPMIGVIGGLVLIIVGVLLLTLGALEFRSIRRVSGIEASRLITTGIYKWSRNPQFLGFFLILLGISLIGTSGYALFMSILAIASSHIYIVKIEEPYLEKIFGEEYLRYKSRVTRYVGFSRESEK